MPDEYKVSARDYLSRAESNLAKNTADALFYAAFELRCGIEARLREYLDAQKHLSRKKKEGWRVAVLGATASKTFKTGDKVARFTIYDTDKRELLATLYYTPVTRALQGYSGKLGNYLHALRKFRPAEDRWWADFRALLNATKHELRRSTRGKLLGAPLVSPSGGLTVYADIDKDDILEWMKGKGRHLDIKVEYFSEYPSGLEKSE